jgi:FkbM family methyltransferase
MRNAVRLIKWWRRQVPVIWSARTKPRRGRLHLVSLDVPGGLGQSWEVWKRVAPREVCIRIGDGTIYFAGSTVNGDRGTFGEVFVAECYRADYHNAVVLDIGAHKGYFGAYAIMHGAKAVSSYEPEEDNFRYLERAARSFRSHGHDWQTSRVAVGSHEREAELRVSTDSWSHSLLRRPEQEERDVAQTVPVVAFGRILENAAEPNDRIIVKIDAEGSECEIVLRTRAESWAVVSELLIETHSFAPCSAQSIVRHVPLALSSANGILHFTSGPSPTEAT